MVAKTDPVAHDFSLDEYVMTLENLRRSQLITPITITGNGRPFVTPHPSEAAAYLRQVLPENASCTRYESVGRRPAAYRVEFGDLRVGYTSKRPVKLYRPADQKST